jgi:hypothetical protein
MTDGKRLSRRQVMSAATALGFAGSSAAKVAAAAEPQPVADPGTRFVFEVRADIAPAIVVGQSAYGLRRLIPITGGRFSGPGLKGEVVPGGGDYQLVRPDGVTAVEARYTLKTDDGALIYVNNQGLIASGAAVRTAPQFEAPVGPYDWLNKSLFIGTLDGSHAAQGYVVLRFFQVT